MGVPLNIDWQQILLHLFNFCLLFGGLWLLLYKPVKGFMQKRTEYYSQMQQEAEKKLAAATKREKEYDARLQSAEQEISDLKSNAVLQANQTAEGIVADANAQREKILNDAKKAADAEKEKAVQEANLQIEGLVEGAIQKMLNTDGGVEEFLNSAGKE